ncbi:tRNA (mnm(5)s(2)U34)-methyltransferase [Roseibacillus ishigakijimensis]|uniref:Methyltransferase domain-containing protein n=1 Tax=Roseibacillus ishigakijimensis TaxID=454146 RepID=A0A934VJL9_9BACT|nr:class I SAM-dependent methyltransferase [Roseibacillus ishigakijimensis]MBK1832744.1 methyltransferase domain-containing protein [Roseibacillus ishigakijimensis]
MTVTEQAKEEVAAVLQEGERAIDGTMGNGWDTLFLAERVGPQGRVDAFDVQEAALASTSKRLMRAGLADRCRLHHCGHEEMARFVREPIAAAMFNLGYLPHSDKRVITRGETTLRALAAARDLLRVGGVLCVVCYRGHEGGMAEAQAVWQWAGTESALTVRQPAVFPEGDKPFLLLLVKEEASLTAANH